jgi:hypothetical protein
MMDGVERHTAKMFERSWWCADRLERRARLQTIVELSVELTKIRSVNMFSTLLGEAAIGDVIEGDWDGLKMWIDHFTFADEGPEIREVYAPIWSHFRDLLAAAHGSAMARTKGQLKS